MIHCVEPFKPQPVTEQHAYLRLLGTDGYYHNCTEDELAQLRGWFEPFETAHVLPNNVAKGGRIFSASGRFWGSADRPGLADP